MRNFAEKCRQFWDNLLVLAKILDARIIVQLNNTQNLEKFRDEIVDVDNLINEIYGRAIVGYRCCWVCLGATAVGLARWVAFVNFFVLGLAKKKKEKKTTQIKIIFWLLEKVYKRLILPCDGLKLLV